MNEVLGQMLAILVSNTGGFLWIASAINLMTFALALRPRIWSSSWFRAVALAQLLIFPAVTALAFHYAIRPVA